MTLFGCAHQPGLISINGEYTCPLCFQQVTHPWYQKRTVMESLTVQETGIDRVAREQEHDWLRKIGVRP